MDTLSSSVTTSTFHVPPPFNPHLSHHHLKPSPLSHHHVPTSSISKSRPSSTNNYIPKKDNFTTLYSHSPRKVVSPLLGHTFRAPRSSVHRRAASGYAAALLDIAQSNGAVLEVGRDVRKLLRLLRNGHVKELMMDGVVEEREKGEAIMEIVEKCKFEGNFVAGLVKMVIGKGKPVEIVKEALEEFERILYHLTPVPVQAT